MDLLDVHSEQAVEAGQALTVYATRWCSDCIGARAVLDACGVSYRWIDINQDEAAADRVVEISGGYRSVPTILFPDGRILVEPSRRELQAALGDRCGQGGELVSSTA
jgi:mycoredoxin